MSSYVLYLGNWTLPRRNIGALYLARNSIYRLRLEKISQMFFKNKVNEFSLYNLQFGASERSLSFDLGRIGLLKIITLFYYNVWSLISFVK